jgi:hypothetical protein
MSTVFPLLLVIFMWGLSCSEIIGRLADISYASAGVHTHLVRASSLRDVLHQHFGLSLGSGEFTALCKSHACLEELAHNCSVGISEVEVRYLSFALFDLFSAPE